MRKLRLLSLNLLAHLADPSFKLREHLRRYLSNNPLLHRWVIGQIPPEMLPQFKGWVSQMSEQVQAEQPELSQKLKEINTLL
ncbi:MAG: hypothetical protein AAF633_04745, partial [Chloroflexota bacterium]